MKRKFYLLFMLLFVAWASRAQNESEPNDNYTQANYFAALTQMQGSVGCSGDNVDIYKIVLPHDGTLKVYISRTNTTNSSTYSNLILEFKNQIGFYNQYQGYVNANSTRYDTLYIPCRTADTLYLKKTLGYGCLYYSLMYEVVNSSEPNQFDNVNNDSLSVAPYFSHADTIIGNLDYVRDNISIDQEDYFKTKTPIDGTVQLIIEKTNTNISGSHLMYVQVLDKNKTVITSEYHASLPAGLTRNDTINLPCRAADSLFVRLYNANGCFKYRMYYNIINQSQRNQFDTEINNSFANAQKFDEGDTIKGNIGYYSAQNNRDDDDYFVTVTPRDGTIRVILKRENTNLSGNQLFYIGFYNKNFSAISTHYNSSVNAGQTRVDTLLIPCRAADTLYIRNFNPTGCFRYQLRYDVINSLDNKTFDNFDNDDFTTAVTINAGDTVKGNIKYISNQNTADNADYYKTLTPTDGTVRIIWTRTNTSDATNSVYLSVYSKNRQQLFNNYLGYMGVGASRVDTVLIPCRAKDSIYIAVTNANACFQYNITYDVISNATVNHFDQGNNDSFTVAKPFEQKDTIKGKISYIDGNNQGDDDDYYVTKIPQKGSLIIYLERTSNAAQGASTHMYLSVYSKNKTSLYSNFLNYMPGGTSQKDTIVLNCIEADSVYLRISKGVGCFDYAIRYEISLGADTSIFVCDGSTADISNLYNTKPFTTVTWTNMSGGVMPPLNAVGIGTYRLTVAKTGSACSNDTAFVIVSNTVKPNLGNDTLVKICQEQSIDLTQLKLVTGATPIWIGTNTPTAVGAGTYQLIATNNQGCSDTATIIVQENPKPSIGNDISRFAWIGESVNFITYIDTTGFGALGWTQQWTSNVNGNTGNTQSTINYTDTVKAQLVVTINVGCKDTALLTIIPANKIVPASSASFTANAEITGTDGWTHYYYTHGTSTKEDDYLLLSLKKNGNNIGSLGIGNFQVKNIATANAGLGSGILITSNVMNNNSGYYTMNRYWEVIPTSQPTSPVGVRYYFNTQDYLDVNNSVGNNRVINDLVLYHLKDGNPDPTTNWAGATLPVVSIMNHNNIISDSTWVYTSLNQNKHRADFTVTSFSGGSAGFTGNNMALPIVIKSFVGIAKHQDAVLNIALNSYGESQPFVIERSIDGKNFYEVNKMNTVKGQDHYQYIDKGVATIADKLFYRIKIQSKGEHFSQVLVIDFNNKESIKVYPNPTKDVLYLLGLTEKSTIKIVNSIGQVVLRETINILQPSLNIQNLSPGHYTLFIENKQGFNVKFIKQ